MRDYAVPGLLLIAALLTLRRRENVYGLMLEGGKEGLQLLFAIVPTLVVLLTAVHMLRASGAIDRISAILAPVLSLAGIPKETVILLLVRPISGSAALAVGADLMMQYGPDSLIGRTAAIMLGSTETTFYTISVYFGSLGIRKTRYAVPAALLADLTGFLAASWTARLLMK